jgi:predicted kinase
LLRSDVVRKQVYGVPPGAWRPEPYGSGLYDARHTAATYDELLRRASVALAGGESVVLDATWLDPRTRDLAAAVARHAYADLVELRCVAPDGLAQRRVLGRALGGADASDATPEVAARIASTAPPWPGAHEVDTERTTPEAAVAIAARHVT